RIQAGKIDQERDVEAQSFAIVARPNANRRGDVAVGREFDLAFAGDALDGREKAGSIGQREQLLGIGTLAAFAAELLRQRKRDADTAIGSGSYSTASADGCRLGFIKRLHGTNSFAQRSF